MRITVLDGLKGRVAGNSASTIFTGWSSSPRRTSLTVKVRGPLRRSSAFSWSLLARMLCDRSISNSFFEGRDTLAALGVVLIGEADVLLEVTATRGADVADPPVGGLAVVNERPLPGGHAAHIDISGSATSA